MPCRSGGICTPGHGGAMLSARVYRGARSMETRYITIHGVCRRYSIGRRTVWRWVREGILPAPVYLAGPGSGARWRVDVLDEHDRLRDAEHNGQAAKRQCSVETRRDAEG